MADPQLVTVATYATSIEAQLAANQLEAQGIQACVSNGAIADMAWFLGSAIGGVKVEVRADDAPAAAQVLAELSHSISELAPDEEDEAPDDPVDEPIDNIEAKEADAQVDRTLRAAVLGLLFFPLQFYSLYLMGRIVFARLALTPPQVRKLLLAGLMNCCVLTLVAMWFWPRMEIPGVILPNGEKAVPMKAKPIRIGITW